MEYRQELPVTPSQRNLLFLQEAVDRKDLYNIGFRVVFDTVVEAGRLRTALDRLLRVQPTLRTEFDLSSGTPRAVITEPAGAPLEIVGHTAGDGDWEPWLEARSREFATEPVDLRQAPLCRFRLLLGEKRSALLCNVHHAISDGVSMEVLLDELCEGYRDADSGAGAVAERERWLKAELAAQCAASEAAVEAGAVRDLAAALADVAPTTLHPLPGRPADTGFRGGILRVLLPTEERARLERTARQLSRTPYCILLAAYAVLLGDYSGNPDVVVGSPFSARRTIASHQLCGFFVNTLPVVLPAVDRPFDEHLAAVSERVREAKRYQSVPFDALVTELAPERSSNRNPVFQCMFAMQDGLRTRRELAPGVGARVEFVHNATSKFDLWLGATPVDDGLELELEYDADLLPASYAERFLAEYRQLLSGALTTPSATTRELLGALDTRERPVLRQGGGADGRAEGGLLGMVLAAARRTPDAVAVTEPGSPGLSYAQLLERAARGAAGLHARGVRRGDTVGLVPDSLPDTVTAMLAILWCGAAYLPIDPALPADRLSYMLATAGSPFLISARPVVPDEPPRAAIGDLEAAGGARLPEPAGTDPVYVMFTSGSTGRPKGVRMGQAALINLLRWQTDALAMGPDTRFLQFAPLGFDVSYQEIFPTLAVGGTVHGLGATDRRDLDRVTALVDEAALTHVYLPVAVLGAFAASALDAGRGLAALRFLCVSGEQLHLDSRAERFLARAEGCRAVNLYGPTETHAVTYQVLPGGDHERPAHVPIGRPLTGVDAYLLGPDGHPVPPGAVGELYLGGVCTADGYVGDEERTAAAFLPVPGDTTGTDRMYRTGDLAVLAEDDTLIFLGRRDAQVKVRGHRVELGEIETAAERLPAVAAAAAAVRGAGEQAALCLFVRAAEGAAPAEGELRAALERTLPTYMIPRHIVTVESVPLTPNGKVDRPALLRRFEAGEFTALAAGGPATTWEPTGTEREVRKLWGELLDREPAGPEDSFFALGGNSFDVLKLVTALERTTGLRVPVGVFFQRPTVRALAAHIDEETATREGPAL
ncbi:non-ribosomal peptide synthetase [Streptomyces sp. ISL-11]|uniref:non-ribosomal peptide synthetase n=1 Tax=Streptomyces sp. ISL-11 TaxID=2819174 RepID=UPI001BEACCC6|nr:non-ribosomal peptide synthetase [Streptomyces sp. ISL-11]MBT2383367.1 amino acid adenylation domain-containing protein [Streptomyces sp. ISL-11]